MHQQTAEASAHRENQAWGYPVEEPLGADASAAPPLAFGPGFTETADTLPLEELQSPSAPVPAEPSNPAAAVEAAVALDSVDSGPAETPTRKKLKKKKKKTKTQPEPPSPNICSPSKKERLQGLVLPEPLPPSEPCPSPAAVPFKLSSQYKPQVKLQRIFIAIDQELLAAGLTPPKDYQGKKRRLAQPGRVEALAMQAEKQSPDIFARVSKATCKCDGERATCDCFDSC